MQLCWKHRLEGTAVLPALPTLTSCCVGTGPWQRLPSCAQVNASDSRGKADSSVLKGVAGKLANSVKELSTNRAISYDKQGRRKKVCCAVGGGCGLSAGLQQEFVSVKPVNGVWPAARLQLAGWDLHLECSTLFLPIPEHKPPHNSSASSWTKWTA